MRHGGMMRRLQRRCGEGTDGVGCFVHLRVIPRWQPLDVKRARGPRGAAAGQSAEPEAQRDEDGSRWAGRRQLFRLRSRRAAVLHAVWQRNTCREQSQVCRGWEHWSAIGRRGAVGLHARHQSKLPRPQASLPTPIPAGVTFQVHCSDRSRMHCAIKRCDQ